MNGYDSALGSNSTYLYSDNYGYVNSNPAYNQFANYYNQPSCPSKSVPGTCLVRPVIITPGFGGVSYNVPGFNSNINNSPLSDSNYFNLTSAYPQYCKTPCLQATYSSN
jgi:hypothetical protein